MLKYLSQYLFILLIIGYNQARYVSRGTCSECLPPLGKSSASLGKGWVGMEWHVKCYTVSGR